MNLMTELKKTLSGGDLPQIDKTDLEKKEKY
jgi:hypothetical protein